MILIKGGYLFIMFKAGEVIGWVFFRGVVSMKWERYNSIYLFGWWWGKGDNVYEVFSFLFNIVL